MVDESRQFASNRSARLDSTGVVYCIGNRTRLHCCSLLRSQPLPQSQQCSMYCTMYSESCGDRPCRRVRAEASGYAVVIVLSTLLSAACALLLSSSPLSTAYLYK